jgi:hypothetical protein
MRECIEERFNSVRLGQVSKVLSCLHRQMVIEHVWEAGLQ